ncbi:hypothetical protein PR048_017111 [Dryococelus australis]|uniref:Uncharacterized protein n=1 Tax=Dryococelus australis TaxID=614101 RepID=A0ABQ9H8S2_9NEOP|nr:hypothetical protein PR048_017111 [Dryococelus australis]
MWPELLPSIRPPPSPFASIPPFPFSFFSSQRSCCTSASARTVHMNRSKKGTTRKPVNTKRNSLSWKNKTVQNTLGPRILACRNSVGRYRCSAGFLGDIPSRPPFHSGAAPYSPLLPSSALNTSRPSSEKDVMKWLQEVPEIAPPSTSESVRIVSRRSSSPGYMSATGMLSARPAGTARCRSAQRTRLPGDERKKATFAEPGYSTSGMQIFELNKP